VGPRERLYRKRAVAPYLRTLVENVGLAEYRDHECMLSALKRRTSCPLAVWWIEDEPPAEGAERRPDAEGRAAPPTLIRVLYRFAKAILHDRAVLLCGQQLPRRRQMTTLFLFLKDESGATAIEYGLIAAGISITIVAAVNSVGVNLNSTFSSISTQLK
jgi:pilus assembly protein Flp/PilA